MGKPLVTHKTWRYLLRDLQNTSAGRELAIHPATTVQGILSAPASVALWIEEFLPELKQRSTLHLVIAGAGGSQDSLDYGRWYQLVPLLLGVQDLKVKVDLVGCALDKTRPPETGVDGRAFPNEPSTTPLRRVAQHWEPSTVYGGTLGKYLDDLQGQSSPDLIFMFHGFQAHADSWLLSGDMRKALLKGVPVGMAAFADDEVMHEIWLLDQYGYGTESKIVENQFTGEDYPGPFPASFARLLWKLANKVPAENQELSPDAVEKNKRFIDWGFRCVSAGHQLPSVEAFGQRFDGIVDSRTSKTAPFVRLPNNYFVNLEDGLVLYQDEGGRPIRLDIEVPDELLTKYPAGSPFDFERAVWSIEVADYVDERTEDDEDAENLLFGEDTAHMLDELNVQLSGRPAQAQTPGSERFFDALKRRQWGDAQAMFEQIHKLVHAVNAKGQTALFLALDAGNLPFADQLLTMGANPSHQDNEGFTPLHDAAQKGYVDKTRLLIERGADVNMRTYMGWSPLLSSLRTGASEVSRLLVEAGADLHQPNLLGMTPAAIYKDMPLEPSLKSLIQQKLAAISG